MSRTSTRRKYRSINNNAVYSKDRIRELEEKVKTQETQLNSQFDTIVKLKEKVKEAKEKLTAKVCKRGF